MDSTGGGFLQRMGTDHEARRRTKFVNEIKKHPQFKASMLQPAKKPFTEVQLGQKPIVVTHAARKTGHETKKPHDWGPLGGWY